jgi:hypothetical protein
MGDSRGAVHTKCQSVHSRGVGSYAFKPTMRLAPKFRQTTP